MLEFDKNGPSLQRWSRILGALSALCLGACAVIVEEPRHEEMEDFAAEAEIQPGQRVSDEPAGVITQAFVPSANIGIKPALDPKTYTSSSVIYDWDSPTCGGHRFDAYIKLFVGEATTAQAYVTKVELHIKATSPNAFTMTPYFTDGSTVWQVSPVSYELATNTWQTFTYDVPDRWFSLSGTTRFTMPVHPHDGACGESTPRFYFKRG